jgi:hypothetical protein
VSTEEFIIKFEGGIAEAHKLPAYNAALSLAGVTRSILIPAAYLEDGRVRYRNLVGTRAFQLNLLTQRPGSFDSVLELISNPVLLGVLSALGLSLTTEFAKDFIYSVIKRSIGQEAEKNIEELETQGKLKSGDMAALVDAISPAMRDAHTTIGNGAHNIYIINGSRNVINLNAATKAYVHTSIDDDELQVRDFSIASFNANTGNGRAFDYEVGRTVAFILDEEADSITINAIAESMRCYAQRRRLGDELSSRVSLKFSAIYAPGRTLKKIRIFEARTVMRDLGQHDSF